MRDAVVVPGRDGIDEPSYARELSEVLRVILVAGIAVGIVLVGLGSRLAMFLLRVTSPDHVRGVVSDDGFVIGRFTLSGTYNLIVIGAAVGVIGAAAYIAVAPWLIGAPWFRRATVGATAGALVGTMLIHADGIDFNLLEPLWLAIALFIALPAMTGVALAVAVDWAASSGSWVAQGRRAVVVPVVLVLLVIPSLIVIVPVAVIVALLLPLRRNLLPRIMQSATGRNVVRGCFLAIPIVSIAFLGQDIEELTS